MVPLLSCVPSSIHHCGPPPSQSMHIHCAALLTHRLGTLLLYRYAVGVFNKQTNTLQLAKPAGGSVSVQCTSAAQLSTWCAGPCTGLFLRPNKSCLLGPHPCLACMW